MSAYWPPLENLPTFDVTVFRDAQDVVDYAVATGTATNIAGGVGGDLLYQSAPNNTAKLPIGTTTYILTSNGSTPQWSPPSVASTPTLANVLLTGNSAGATNIDMNLQNITNATAITATTFNGNLNGNANTANTASTSNNIALTSDDSTTTCFIPFSKTTSGTSNALFIDNTTTPLRYRPSTGEVSTQIVTIGGILNPAAGDIASRLLQFTGANPVLEIRNFSTSGRIRLVTLDALNAAVNVLTLSTTEFTTITTNNPTITGFTDPPTTDTTAKIPTTRWVQSALTSGVATATTIQVTDNNTAITMYPIFCTATAGQKSLLFDSSTTPLRYKPSTSELSADRFSVGNILEPVSGDNAGFIAQNTGASATVIQNQATSGRIYLAVRDAGNFLSNAIIIASSGASGEKFAVGNIVDPVSGDNAGFIAQNTGASATTVQNQATSGLIHLAVRNASNLLSNAMVISSSNCTITTTNNPTITGFTDPVASNSSNNIATTRWVQSAITAGFVSTTAAINTTTLLVTGTFYLPFLSSPTGATSQTLYTGSGLSYDASTTRLTGTLLDLTNILRFRSATASERSINNTFYNLYGNDAVAGGTYRGRIYSNASTTFFEFPNLTHNFSLNYNTAGSPPTANPFLINPTDLTITTTNNPTITGFTDPAASNSSNNIATTRWVQSAITAGTSAVASQVTLSNTASGSTNYLVMSATASGTSSLLTDNSGATYDSTTNTAVMNITANAGSATLVNVDPNDTATTHYITFVEGTGAGNKALRIDPTPTPLRYKPSTSEVSADRFSVGGILEPASGDNAGFLAQNTGSSATVVQNQATSGLVQLITRDAVNAAIVSLQTSSIDTIIYSRNVRVDNGSGNPITVGNGASTATSNIIMTSLSLAATRNFTLGGNVIIGSAAGNSLPVAATDNTFVGDSSGFSATGSTNICIGYNAQVPTAANSNQIAIGTASETLYVRGGFNWRVGTQITASITLTAPLAQFYTVVMGAASQTVTLPAPNATTLLGATITFKRKTNTTQFTIAAGAGTPFITLSSITAAATTVVTTTIFQVTFICDGTHWCRIV